VKADDDTGLQYRFSFQALEDYRLDTAIFRDVFAFDVRLGGIGDRNGKPTQFVYQAVTGNFFSGLQLTPAAGRLFEPGEGERANAEPVVVLGYAFWVRQFGADPSIVGQQVRLDGQSTRVVGVAPRDFHGLFEGAEMDGYTPFTGIARVSGRAWVVDADRLLHDRSARVLTMVARLQPDVTIERAQAAASVIAARLATTYPATDNDSGVRVVPETLARPVPLKSLATALPLARLLSLALASLVLLIACMNVANLLLIRATVRQREMAVRAALGSGRHRLVRLLLVESLFLSIAGTAAGLLVGSAASTAFGRSIDVGMDAPVHLDFGLDWRVFFYSCGVAMATALFVGVMPALRASRARITDLLHDGGRGDSAGAGRQRARSGLVVAQVAGSVALLVVAGLFVRSLQRAHEVDLGFDPSQVTIARLNPGNLGYSRDRSDAFYDRLLDRLRDAPGLEHVAQSFSQPLGYNFGGYVAFPEGANSSATRAATGSNSVTPAFFDTLRIPIVRGRAFTDRDVKGAPRAGIVNETLADRFWPGADPLGKRFYVPETGDEAWQVVGVARDAKYLAVFETRLPYFYLPQAQSSSYVRTLYIRSALPTDEVATRLEREIRELEPDLPIMDLRSMRSSMAGNVGFLFFRIGAVQTTMTAVLGLCLALVGIYGLISYRTAQRSREIGIRLALGAQPGDVGRLVARQGGTLVAAGIAVGGAVSILLSALASRLLTLVDASDPATFVATGALLASAASVACYIPARRAMRTDPLAALRHE